MNELWTILSYIRSDGLEQQVKLRLVERNIFNNSIQNIKDFKNLNNFDAKNLKTNLKHTNFSMVQYHLLIVF